MIGAGQRVRKISLKAGVGFEERIYFGDTELYRTFDFSSSLTLERTTTHVSDGTGRIAMLEVRTHGSDSYATSVKRFIYTNHLQTSTLEIDGVGNIISYEDHVAQRSNEHH